MRHRGGFTLIEVVAALVLMTMLFAAIVTLLRSFSAQAKTLDRIAEANPPTQRLAELIRSDLANSRFLSLSSNSMRLTGNLAKDHENRQPIGHRAEVTYAIKMIAQTPWLMRREIDLDENSTQRGREQPIWQGATSIAMTGQSAVGNSDASIAPNGMTPTPARFKLIVFAETQETLLTLNVVHHWEDN